MASAQDDLGLPLSTNPPAAAAYRRAVDAQLHAWPGVREAVDAALAHDPGFALAHALRALDAASGLRRAEARAGLEQARQAAPKANERERSHVAVVASLLLDKPAAALAAAQAHAARWPTDALVASMLLGAFGLFAFSGRADHDALRLAFVRELAPHYPSDHPWMLAHRGWAHIEAGEVQQGMPLAEQSLALRPANGNAAHVVMHGWFELNQPARALRFIEDWLPQYPPRAMLWGHLQWHAALSELALGQPEAALARHTRHIVAHLLHSPPLVGLSDAASLLWRLRLLGRENLPWAEASAYGERHFPRGGNVFAELHLALLAAGQGDTARLLVGQSRLQAAADAGHGAAPVALRWIEALLAIVQGDTAGARQALGACEAGAVRLGGSHAQRDVVARTRQWVEAAAAASPPGCASGQ